MKKLIVILILFVGFAVAATAQISWNYAKYDSLVNADTITYNIAPIGLSRGDFYYSIQIKADSATGSTAGIAYLEVSNHVTGDYWHRVDSTTINGVTTKDYNTGTFQCYRARLFITSTGTQKTYVRLGIHGIKR